MKNNRKINNPRRGPQSRVEQDAGLGSRRRDFLRAHEAQVNERIATKEQEQQAAAAARAEEARLREEARQRAQEQELLLIELEKMKPENILSPEVFPLFELTRDNQPLPDEYKIRLLQPEVKVDQISTAVELGIKEGWAQLRSKEF